MRQGLSLAPQSLLARPVDSTMVGTGSVGSVGAASSGATVLGWDAAQDGQGGARMSGNPAYGTVSLCDCPRGNFMSPSTKQTLPYFILADVYGGWGAYSTAGGSMWGLGMRRGTVSSLGSRLAFEHSDIKKLKHEEMFL